MADSSNNNSVSTSTTTSSSTTLTKSTLAPSNLIACNAITSKLSEVSKIAESLDFILKDMQSNGKSNGGTTTSTDLEVSSNSSEGKKIDRRTVNNDSRSSAEVSKLHYFNIFTLLLGLGLVLYYNIK